MLSPNWRPPSSAMSLCRFQYCAAVLFPMSWAPALGCAKTMTFRWSLSTRTVSMQVTKSKKELGLRIALFPKRLIALANILFTKSMEPMARTKVNKEEYALLLAISLSQSGNVFQQFLQKSLSSNPKSVGKGQGATLRWIGALFQIPLPPFAITATVARSSGKTLPGVHQPDWPVILHGTPLRDVQNLFGCFLPSPGDWH